MGELVHRFGIWVGVAIGLGVAALRKNASALAKSIGRALYARLASTWLVRTALRTYIKKLHAEFEHFHAVLPGARNLNMPMRTVYTPLSAVTFDVLDRGAARDVAVSLQDEKKKRTVVLGVPGAGKSMSLRQQVFEWADAHRQVRTSRWAGREWRRTRIRVRNLTHIPVLVELNRFDPDRQQLSSLISDTMDRRGFPNAGKWVQGALRKNRLAVYLDGLDEVATALRPAVINKITDFARNYEGFVVVTCRTAVYDNQLGDVVDQTLQVEGFSEFQIRRFLHGWAKAWAEIVAGAKTRRQGETLADDTVERLMRELHNAPQLMALAKNPFLLTLIAFLYSSDYAESGQALPHTRVAFYDEVTEALLKDRSRPTAYPYAIKRRVLRDLALAAQDVPSRAHDRLALPADQVLASARRSLLNDGRPVEDAPGIIEDIVERTGLLLEVDGGDRYQFAHLTLQEFLAAERLAADEDGILTRFERDPDTWHETVRLWCGISDNDRTEFVRTIYALDPLLAFQCLADAKTIDEALVDTIANRFRGRSEPEVLAAFGFVAADTRPIGTKLFAVLCEDLRASRAGLREVAIRALAATNTGKAARVLCTGFDQDDQSIYRALSEMGDLAVSALVERIAEGSELALTALSAIRTPSSTRSAVALLWTAPDSLQPKVALHVGELLALPELRATFEEMTSVPLNAKYAWVSNRYSFLGDGFAKVSARVIEVLQETDEPVAPGSAALWNWMLARALTLVPREPVTLDKQLINRELENESAPAYARRIRRPSAPEQSADLSKRLVDSLVAAGMPERHRQLLLALSEGQLSMVLGGLFRSGHFLTRDQWEHADERAQFTPNRSWHTWSALALFTVFCGLAVDRAVPWHLLGNPWGPLWLDWTAIGAITLGCLSMGWETSENKDLVDILGLGLIGAVYLWDSWNDRKADTVRALGAVGLCPAACFFAFIAIRQPAGVALAILFLLLVIGAVASLLLRALILEDRYDSPVMRLAVNK